MSALGLWSWVAPEAWHCQEQIPRPNFLLISCGRPLSLLKQEAEAAVWVRWEMLTLWQRLLPKLVLSPKTECRRLNELCLWTPQAGARWALIHPRHRLSWTWQNSRSPRSTCGVWHWLLVAAEPQVAAVTVLPPPALQPPRLCLTPRPAKQSAPDAVLRLPAHRCLLQGPGGETGRGERGCQGR